uniref:Uncharacterized protein n=1 Tax=Anguilla anguilla TaxID=7936 RepID=A0A0E9V405_ANGAN
MSPDVVYHLIILNNCLILFLAGAIYYDPVTFAKGNWLA